MEEVAARRAAPEPLDRALLAGRRAAEGLSATIDARILHGATAGTQVHTRELIAALHRTGAVRMRVLLSPDVGGDELARLEALEGVERVAAGELGPATRPSLIVHRPYQVSSAGDLPTLRAVGHRLVVTHQDLLAYHNPAYHPDAATWSEQRRLTRSALGVADAVVVFSGHAARDLAAEDLAPAGRVHEVPCGTDHLAAADPGAAPAELAALARPPVPALPGDRPAAQEPPVRARRARGAAPRAAGTAGSCSPARTCRTARPPATSARAGSADAQLPVVDLGAVDEPAKARLYRDAAAVLYPTLSEGFGLIPFEAAAAGTPPLFACGLLARRPAARRRRRCSCPGTRRRAPAACWRCCATPPRRRSRSPACAPPASASRGTAPPPRWSTCTRPPWRVRPARRPRWAGPRSRRRRGAPRPSTRTTAWSARSPRPAARSWAATALLDEQGQRTLAGLLRRRVTGPPTRAVLRLLGRAVRAGGGAGAPLALTAMPSASPAVVVDGVNKTFVRPHESMHTLKERALHPVPPDGARRASTRCSDVSFAVEPRRVLRDRRPQRLGQEHAAEVPRGDLRDRQRRRSAIDGRLSTFIELGVGFNPDLAARDNVDAQRDHARPARAREAEERYERIIEFAELREFEDLKLKNYSSGMLVRLAFSVMIQVDADILLIDEVLAVGDAAFQQKCFDEFNRLRDERRDDPLRHARHGRRAAVLRPRDAARARQAWSTLDAPERVAARVLRR